ncbi:hypothetical protein HNQ51_003194 [Inhella inkyongensis]|uniref:Uncharacterized protein n=1 Tax=Inhella inkyongensis TaxID=392593 RepID=A0A840S861_9BURK|nr:hypothetical protein [Inhella inkyongensis]MBB5205863.1 hypothetical protein [Inhella inkyongensis]
MATWLWPPAQTFEPAAASRSAEAQIHRSASTAAPTQAATASSPPPTAERLPSSASEFKGPWAQRDRVWCGQIDQAHAEPNESVREEKVVALHIGLLPLQRSPIREELLADWERRLRARPDALHQALAERVWLHRQGEGDDGAGRQRLQSLAERSEDPRIAGLWASWSCSRLRGDCAQAAALWQRLEPTNLNAHLVRLPSEDAPEAEFEDFARRLLASLGGFAPEPWFLQQLLAFEAESGPGLRRTLAYSTVDELFLVQPMPAWRGLLKRCQRSSQHGPTGARCEALAEHLWRHGREAHVTERLLLRMVSSNPTRAPVWKDRAHEAQARAEMIESNFDLKVAFNLWAATCEAKGPSLERIRKRISEGDISWVKPHMPSNRDGILALSQEYRSRKGRGFLDEMPAPKPQN